MATESKLSESERTRRAEIKKEREAEERTATRVELGDHGVRRVNLKAARAERKAARDRRKAAEAAGPTEPTPADAESDKQHKSRRIQNAKENAEYMKKFRARQAERKRMDTQNLAIDIVPGRVPNYGEMRVNRHDAQILALHNSRPNEWTSEMVSAHGKFGRDYATASFAGLSCSGFEPQVDGGKGGGMSGIAVVARLQLGDLKKEIGAEAFAYLEVFSGLGKSLSQMQAAGLGEKRILSDRVRSALSQAAVFYRYLDANQAPHARFLRKARELVEQVYNET